MPDQSSAADEHAILSEITAPLATLPDNPVPLAANADFPIVLRGYDRMAVDAYVKRISQLVAELQSTRSPEAAVRRALERVGEQISGILQRAHETAEQITVQSRREAEERLEVARQEAEEITADAHQRVKDLDADTDRIWAERLRIVEDARELAAQLTSLADSAAERFPPADEGATEVAGQGAGVTVPFDAEADVSNRYPGETLDDGEMQDDGELEAGDQQIPGQESFADHESFGEHGGAEQGSEPQDGPDDGAATEVRHHEDHSLESDETAVLPPAGEVFRAPPPPDDPPTYNG